MESKFETLKEIDEYASENNLSDEERRALIERRMQIFFRIRDWREENKKLGLEPTISDHWTPQQRESFLRDWFDDDLINMEASCSDEMMNEGPFDVSLEKHLEKKRGPLFAFKTKMIYVWLVLLWWLKQKLKKTPSTRVSLITDDLCRREWLKNSTPTPAFEVYLTEYQINIVSKEYNNKIIYSGPDKDKRIYQPLRRDYKDASFLCPRILLSRMQESVH